MSHQGNRVKQELMIEDMERYYQLLMDMNTAESLDGDCCTQSTEHNICYDIKQGQFRRRKKKHSSTRYYSSYLGKHKRWTGIACNQKNDDIQIILTADDEDTEYWFKINK